jgi:hypothetical protein
MHVPAPVLVYNPVPTPIVPTPGHEQNHVPPEVAFVSTELAPAHIMSAPPIAPGNAFIVATAAIPQPEPRE